MTYPVKLATKEIGFVRIESKKGIIIIDRGSETEDSENKIKKVKEKKSQVELKFQTGEGSWVHIEVDENGRIIYPKFFTKVEIFFEVSDIRANPSTQSNAKFLDDLCKKFLERFLFSYMYGIKDFSIDPTKNNVWPEYKVLKVYEFSDEDLEWTPFLVH
jgi:hypothetical protein